MLTVELRAELGVDVTFKVAVAETVAVTCFVGLEVAFRLAVKLRDVPLSESLSVSVRVQVGGGCTSTMNLSA